MKFYTRERGNISWQNPLVSSTICLIRDWLLSLVPIPRLPKILVKLIYGVDPKFVFYLHPRRTEDLYVGFPILSFIRRVLGKKLFLRFLSMTRPVVLDYVKAEKGVEGLVIASLVLPADIIKRTKQSLRLTIHALFLASKICGPGVVFGLGGLWPMATRRGLAVDRFARRKGVIVTNGHCGTLLSLYSSIQRIAQVSGFPLEDMKIMVLGVGKMGANLVKVLYGKVASITMVDTNEKRLDILEKKLKETISETDIFKYTNKSDTGSLRSLFEKNHVVICMTSNVRRILMPSDIPANIIIIDDSRPEAIPRDLNHNGIVLEGGLLKIKGLKQRYNFGIGLDENTFGCLAESFVLAACRERGFLPSLGDVSLANFEKMLEVSQDVGVSTGDFKTRDRIISDEIISHVLLEKDKLRHTLSFKHVCWLLKTEDLLVEERVLHE